MSKQQFWGLHFTKVYPFLSWKKIGFTISSLFILAGIVFYLLRGGFVLGIDFIGGIRSEVLFQDETTIEDVRNGIKDFGGDSEVTKVLGSDNRYLITISQKNKENFDSDELVEFLNDKFGSSVEVLSLEAIGSKMGNTFMYESIKLIFLVSLLILVYISLRFNFVYAVGAIAALFHDIFIMLATTLIFGIRLDVTIIAAFLTILGYSINDTIVIFDRIRENDHKKGDLAALMNKSISQSLSRTLMTSITTFFIALSIFLFAGYVLRDFGLLLMVGIISGTYSSIFIASPISYLLYEDMGKRKKDKNKKKILDKV